MTQHVDDLRAEGHDLNEFLEDLSDGDWSRPTPFKGRTVNWVIQHLHDADRWTCHSISDPEGFRAWQKLPLSEQPRDQVRLEGRRLREKWIGFLYRLCDMLDHIDPQLRAPWFGPDMGIRMMTTARQMETWAHGQDIYDLLHHPRTNYDRIRSVCHIGVATYAWTFVNRGLTIPEPAPYVRLTGPTGTTWEWNDHSTDDLIEGSAVEFAHVVTQGRNIRDVNLSVRGRSAITWMEIAQCFSGPPEAPPAPGTRSL